MHDLIQISIPGPQIE